MKDGLVFQHVPSETRNNTMAMGPAGRHAIIVQYVGTKELVVKDCTFTNMKPAELDDDGRTTSG